MSQKMTLIIAGIVAGIFMLNLPEAHAILGVRAARAALAARKAKQMLSEKEDKQEENKSLQDLKPQGRGRADSETAKATE